MSPDVYPAIRRQNALLCSFLQFFAVFGGVTGTLINTQLYTPQTVKKGCKHRPFRHPHRVYTRHTPDIHRIHTIDNRFLHALSPIPKGLYPPVQQRDSAVSVSPTCPRTGHSASMAQRKPSVAARSLLGAINSSLPWSVSRGEFGKYHPEPC